MTNAKSLRTGCCAALLLGCGMIWTTAALAQRDDYKVAPGRETAYDVEPGLTGTNLKRAMASVNRSIRERRNTIREGLDADNPFTKERQNEFDKWYLGYEFPT